MDAQRSNDTVESSIRVQSIKTRLKRKDWVSSANGSGCECKGLTQKGAQRVQYQIARGRCMCTVVTVVNGVRVFYSELVLQHCTKQTMCATFQIYWDGRAYEACACVGWARCLNKKCRGCSAWPLIQGWDLEWQMSGLGCLGRGAFRKEHEQNLKATVSQCERLG